jgi:DNA (cytosine-5)-methyltransferase 1
MLSVGSLFSGVGGIELGLERTGYFKTHWQCEVDIDARRVLQKHWPSVPCFNDIKNLIDPPAIDVLCGGFPCQDISVAGKGEGLAGKRSGLWYEYLRIIEAVQPRYVVIENVAALKTRGLEVVLENLAQAGYDAEWETLEAPSFGSPCRRSRMFIVAYPSSLRLEESESVFACGPNIREFNTASVVACWQGVQVDRSRPGDYNDLPIGPAVLRVADGISRWSHISRKEYSTRIGQLGNAVMPVMAEYVGECIKRFDLEHKGSS